jgi:hypothetical protein
MQSNNCIVDEAGRNQERFNIIIGGIEAIVAQECPHAEN